MADSTHLWMRLLQPSWRRLAVLLVLGLLIAALEAIVVGLLLSVGEAALGRPIPRIVMDAVVIAQGFVQAGPMALLAFGLIAAIAAKLVLGLWHELWTARWRSGLLQWLQIRIFKNYLYAGRASQIELKQGDFLNALITLPFKATEAALVIPRVASGIAVVLAISLVLLRLSAQAFLLAFALGIVFGIGVAFVTRRFVLPSNRRRVEIGRRQTELATEIAGGLRELRSHGVAYDWARQFAREVEVGNRLWEREQVIILAPARILEALVMAGLAAAAAIASAITPDDQLIAVLPLIASFGYGLVRLYPALTTVGQGAIVIASATPRLEAMRPWLELPRDPLDAPGASPPPLRSGIEFGAVSFGYPGRDAVFSGLSFHITANRATAITGPSGSGKSTLIDLLLKGIAPERGSIRVDGMDLARIDRKKWLDQIGFVSQDSFLFHATIAENVRLGHPAASEAEIQGALRKAGLDEFVSSLPQGPATIVGSRGLALSGGQRQRLALARALIRAPRLLVLDEATNALDAPTEQRIIETVLSLREECTVVVVTHREAVALQCDQTVTLGNPPLPPGRPTGAP